MIDTYLIKLSLVWFVYQRCEEELDEPVAPGLGADVKAAWHRRKEKLEHDYAITGWALCVSPEVRADVNARMTGDHRNAIERLVVRMHTVPCPNEDAIGMDESELIDTFWNEYKQFNQKSGAFGYANRWNSPDVRAGNSHTWHEKYSLPHTKVLGHVACRACSKCLGIGSAERNWGDAKHIKSGKRSHMSAEAIEKRTILYTTARVTEARMRRPALERDDATGLSAMFGDDDMK